MTTTTHDYWLSPDHLAKYLSLAEAARRDPTLLSNHRGQVDKALLQQLEFNLDLLSKIEGDNELPITIEVAENLRTENTAIRRALTVYESSH
jgi:primosomal protein N''